MEYTKLIPTLSLKDPIKMATYYNDCGADEVAYFDSQASKEGREPDIELIKKIKRSIDIPLIYCGGIKKLEDAKKVLYAGAAKICMKSAALNNPDIVKEISDRFGSDRVIITIDMSMDDPVGWAKKVKELGAGRLFLLGADTETYVDKANEIRNAVNLPIMVSIPYDDYKDVAGALLSTGAEAGAINTEELLDIMSIKQECVDKGVVVNTFKSAIEFSEFKTDDKGLVPCIVQNYKTDEVLMLAYMNEESFNKTIATGKMTYFSRSRNKLWTKGEESGHWQYVKSLEIDCDKDTILAEVSQIGPACHTGSKTCFFTDLVRKEYDDTNPLTVFEDVYNVIVDRKKNPREGSYTNYLFDKGIDKILKKVGEECTEIVIAAKNPDAEEIKYEISDFMYHCMVLMVERGVTWKDITDELAERR